MCVALVGGMDRLERHYRDEGARLGIDMRIFSRSETNMSAKLRHVDAMVIFTNKVSHQARNEALGAAKANSIPVFMCHSCGVCSLRECFSRLRSGGGKCQYRNAGSPERTGEERRRD